MGYISRVNISDFCFNRVLEDTNNFDAANLNSYSVLLFLLVII